MIRISIQNMQTVVEKWCSETRDFPTISRTTNLCAFIYQDTSLMTWKPSVVLKYIYLTLSIDMNWLYTQRVCGEIDKIARCMTLNNTAALKFGSPVPRESDACPPNLSGTFEANH